LFGELFSGTFDTIGCQGKGNESFLKAGIENITLVFEIRLNQRVEDIKRKLFTKKVKNTVALFHQSVIISWSFLYYATFFH